MTRQRDIDRLDIPNGTQVIVNELNGLAGVVVDRAAGGFYVVNFPGSQREQRLFSREQLVIHRANQKEAFVPDENPSLIEPHIAYLAEVGSRAYGLDGPDSDEDLRGFYIAPLPMLLQLRGAPETVQLAGDDTTVWEVAKLLRMALSANPNVLETLYAPVVKTMTEPARLLIENRDMVLSQRIHATYQGYAMSQMKKLEQDLRARGTIRWKHASHLIRLLLSGIHAMHTGEPLIDVGTYREQLLAIRRGECTWELVDVWRQELHKVFEKAAETSPLPHEPDRARADLVLLRIREVSARDWLTQAL